METELKERIITEATRMFCETGIKSVRMDDIAAACGISKRTLYEIFSDRENLIRQSILYNTRENDDMMKERLAGAKNAIDEFWILFLHGSEMRASTKLLVKDLMKFYPRIFEEIMQTHHSHIISRNRQRLEKGIAQGLFLGNIDTEFMSRILTRYLYGLHQDFADAAFSSDYKHTNTNDSSLLFATMLFFRGIATDKGRRYIDENIFKEIERIYNNTGKLG